MNTTIPATMRGHPNASTMTTSAAMAYVKTRTRVGRNTKPNNAMCAANHVDPI